MYKSACGGQKRAPDSPVAGVTGSCELPAAIQTGFLWKSRKDPSPLSPGSSPECSFAIISVFNIPISRTFKKISGHRNTICKPVTAQEGTASAGCRHIGGTFQELS